MKKQIQIIIMSIILLLCIFALSACGPASPSEAPAVEAESSQPEPSSGTEPENSAAPKPGGPAAPLVRTDDEGLVQVVIKDGAAVVTYDYDRWNELHDIYALAEEYDYRLEDKPYPIEGLSGKVVDACIGRVAALDIGWDSDFILPSILLLMEDGSVEWVLADPWPALSGKDDTLVSQGVLPWLTDIVSLAYEAETEGMGEMTVYAIDAAGLRYDVRIPCEFMGLFSTEWICEIDLSEGEGAAVYVIALEFAESGQVSMTKGWQDESQFSEIYNGTYTITLAENDPDGWRPGLITFDLAADWWSWEGNPQIAPPEDIYGTYFADGAYDTLLLSLSEGGPLHYDKYSQPMEHYEFWPTRPENNIGVDTMSMTDEELVAFLLSQVPQAYDRVMPRGGMSTLVTGETSMIDELICRDVWLGTDLDGKFTREILYTIDPYGLIYEYDPVGDGWSLAN